MTTNDKQDITPYLICIWKFRPKLIEYAIPLSPPPTFYFSYYFYTQYYYCYYYYSNQCYYCYYYYSSQYYYCCYYYYSNQYYYCYQLLLQLILLPHKKINQRTTSSSYMLHTLGNCVFRFQLKHAIEPFYVSVATVESLLFLEKHQ